VGLAHVGFTVFPAIRYDICQSSFDFYEFPRITKGTAVRILSSFLRRSRLTALAISALLAVGCSEQSKVTVIKLGHGLDPTHPVHKSMLFMAERVAELSGGTMSIDIYPSQQLGTERECLELLQIGSLGMTKSSSSVIEQFAPSYRVLGLPYLFRDQDHMYKVLEGAIGQRLLTDAVEYKLRGITFFDAGSRSFYTKEKPVMEPADLDGMKIRVQESFMAFRMVSALGGSPTPISWGELYTALQQGVVDGAENNPPSFYISRQYEVCKYYSLDEHTSVPDVLLMSTVLWNTLTSEQQDIVLQAATEAAQLQKVLWKEATDHALAEVQAAGVEVFHPDKSLFSAKVADVYESFRDQPEIYQLIQDIKAVQ